MAELVISPLPNIMYLHSSLQDRITSKHLNVLLFYVLYTHGYGSLCFQDVLSYVVVGNFSTKLP